MKSALRIILLLLTLSINAFASPPAAQADPDPIVGKWIWPGGLIGTVFADGTAVSKDGTKGTWKFLDDKQAERKYTFVWGEGIFIQNLTASKDMKTLKGKDNHGNRLTVQRAPDEKPMESKP